MEDKLKILKEQGLLRELKTLCRNGIHIEYEGKQYLNFSSNDYLGISGMGGLQTEFFQSLDMSNYLMGAMSSRLLTGNDAHIEGFEKYLSELYSNECLVYNSGYHANIGILPALVEKGDLVVADKLVHASLIDGIKLCSAEFKRYKHNDCNDLERILSQNAGQYKSIFIVTESIFSMDGDTADLKRIVKLKEQYGAKLYLDEAHAFGIVGETGLGCAHDAGLTKRIDYLVCTLGKAAASEGAFLICDKLTKQWLVNKSRTLIFTTAAPPLNVLWSKFIVSKIVEMKKERKHLAEMTRMLRNKLAEQTVIGNTHIVPIVTGSNEACINLSDKMRRNGVWAMPVRYPTVPLGQARIRLSLVATMNSEHIDKACQIIINYELL